MFRFLFIIILFYFGKILLSAHVYRLFEQWYGRRKRRVTAHVYYVNVTPPDFTPSASCDKTHLKAFETI